MYKKGPSRVALGKACVLCVGFSSALFLFYLQKGVFIMINEKMYYRLFNELTDILEDIKKLEERIKRAQLETEEMYINEEEPQ